MELDYKGQLVGLCTVCSRPICIRGWHKNRDQETCHICWFDVLSGDEMRAEARRLDD